MTGIHHVRHKLSHVVRAGRGEFGLGRIAEFDFADCCGNRIPGFVSFDLDGGSVGTRVRHRMAPVTVRFTFEKLRTTTRVDAFDGAPRRFVDFKHVCPVDPLRGDVIGCGALVDLNDCRMPVYLRANRIWLFSQTKSKGSRHSAAMFSDS